MKLVLGVIDLPYALRPSPRQKKPRGGTVTTGDVAEWLENKYGVMRAFAIAKEAEIANDLTEGLRKTVESMMLGAPPSSDPFAPGTTKIESSFRDFISTGEIERLGIPGVPTQASLDRASGRRRSARFKKARGPAPGKSVSFIDTGLYESSMKAWVE